MKLNNLIVGIILFYVFPIFAKQVDEITAKTVGTNFLK